MESKATRDFECIICFEIHWPLISRIDAAQSFENIVPKRLNLVRTN